MDSYSYTNCPTEGQFRLSGLPDLCVFGLWEENQANTRRGHANSAQKPAKLTSGLLLPCYYYQSHPVSLFYLFLSPPFPSVKAQLGNIACVCHFYQQTVALCCANHISSGKLLTLAGERWVREEIGMWWRNKQNQQRGEERKHMGNGEGYRGRIESAVISCVLLCFIIQSLCRNAGEGYLILSLTLLVSCAFLSTFK